MKRDCAKVLRSAFVRRSCTIYRHQRDRAADRGDSLDYSLVDLREIIRRSLGRCGYCLGPMDALNFSCDHATPIIRGGGFGVGNLVVCCRDCNTAKGVMSEREYRSLLKVMSSWPEDVRRNTLARLKAGAKAARYKG